MKKAAWLVGFGSVAVALGAACGGKVTFVDGSGSGSGGGDSTSSGSTSKGSTSTGTKPTCDELRDAFVDAAFAAQACDPKLDELQCDGSVIILDSCDCPSLVLNEDHPDLVKKAIAARAAWSGAGCPSLDCGACFEAQGGACDGQGPNGGICIGLSLN